MRVSEIASLKVRDIESDPARMLIRIEQGKGRKDRYAKLSDPLLQVLRAWWQVGRDQGVMLTGKSRGDGWLFPGEKRSKPLSTRQLRRAFYVAKEAASIDKRVCMHTLRHCCATHMLEQGADIRVIQVMLGHTLLETTARYSQVASKTLRAVTSPLELLPATKKKKKAT